MRYKKLLDKIVVTDCDDFDATQTLDCGQIFRYKIEGNVAKVCSKDKMATLITKDDEIVIETNDVDYFENFFDLKTDYTLIKQELRKDEFLIDAVEYGHGIRIIKNDTYEMIVSYIISANNNISRIKKSIEYLCSHFGKDMGDYFAFPTLSELKRATLEDYKQAGLGYRAEYMLETVGNLTETMIEDLKLKSSKEQFEFLLSLKGIGEKVANCIMLFGLGVKDVFPVDTWINKVYNKLTNSTCTDRKKITRELTARYGELSGYAQQYVFYYFRDNKLE